MLFEGHERHARCRMRLPQLRRELRKTNNQTMNRGFSRDQGKHSKNPDHPHLCVAFRQLAGELFNGVHCLALAVARACRVTRR